MPSLLDRLLDTGTPPRNRPQPAAADPALRNALARDLEALLNTRIAEPRSRLAGHPMAAESILSFGLPDNNGLSLHVPADRLRLADQVRRAIQRHEPRLARVQVAIVSEPGGGRPVQLRIDAELRPASEHAPICFDATLQLSSNAYRVHA